MQLTAVRLLRDEILGALNEKDASSVIDLWVTSAALERAHAETFGLSHPLAVMSRSVIGQIAGTVRDYAPQGATDEHKLISRARYKGAETAYEFIAHTLNKEADHNEPLLVLVAARGRLAPDLQPRYILLQGGFRNTTWSSPWRPPEPPGDTPNLSLLGVTIKERKATDPIHPELAWVATLLQQVADDGLWSMSTR